VVVLQANPQAALPALGWVCEAFCSWNRDYMTERSELHQHAVQTLQAFKLHCGQNWPVLWDTLHATVQTKMTQLFSTER
jgi:hypothetical protein